MPKRPDKSAFEAPQLRLDGDPDRFEQTLLGFCVTAQLDQHAKSRSWWADRLDLSRSHMTKMVDEPSVRFVEQLDLVLADDGVEQQRLHPRLSEFYAGMRPDERTDNTRPVLDWLARYPEALKQRPVAECLLTSEVALTRCRLRDRNHDLENDELIDKSINELLILASGPYGGSNVAHQRCAELGLFVPETFLRLLTQHFDSSPVGFRLLRTLDRFINVWRRRISDPDMLRSPHVRIDRRITILLRRLSRASSRSGYIDPYPGGEWGITLARDCLRTQRELGLAHEWLETTCKDTERSDRERLYAAWARIPHCKDKSTLSSTIDILLFSDSDMLRHWGKLFKQMDTLQGISARERSDMILKVFKSEHELVNDAVTRTSDGDEKLFGVRDALQSVIIAALITPDGQLRRNLIEAVVAAGLVRPTTDVLVEVYKRREAIPGIRESIVFFLSRLRQSTPDVAEVLKSAALEDNMPSVIHAALWGMGDVFRSDSPDPVTYCPILDGSRSLRPRPSLHRMAAAHALAVMASATAVSPGAPDADTRERSSIRKALTRVKGEAAKGKDRPSGIVVALCEWGLAMAEKPDAIANPMNAKLRGLLERYVPEEYDLGFEDDAVSTLDG